MSIRPRIWTGPDGSAHRMWTADYRDAKRQRHRKDFEKKKDAEEWLNKAKFEIRQGIHTPDAATVSVEEAAKLWMDSCEARKLERSTLNAYHRHIELHIVPFIGGLKLNQLSAPRIREFQTDLAKDRSPAMVKKILRSLSSLLSDAQDRGLIAVNAAHQMRLRHKGAEHRAEKRQKGKLEIGVDIPSPAEIRAFLAAVDGRWKPLVMTVIFTGLRSSEVRGLRWSDIDLKEACIFVRQRVDEFGEFGPPKSAAGTRRVPIPQPLIPVLQEWFLACPKKGHLGLAFPTNEGTPHSHANVINRAICPAMISAKLLNGKKAKYTGLHSLRHFYASWCINAVKDGGLGLTPKAVQERMGHNSILMTLDSYGHLFPSSDDGSALAEAARLLLS